MDGRWYDLFPGEFHAGVGVDPRGFIDGFNSRARTATGDVTASKAAAGD